MENKFNTHNQVILHFKYEKVLNNPVMILQCQIKSLVKYFNQLFVATTKYSNNVLIDKFFLTKYDETKLSMTLYLFLFLSSIFVLQNI